MTALARIALLELRTLARDRTLAIACAVFLVSVAYALHCGRVWHGELRASAQQIEAKDRALLLKQREILLERERAGDRRPRGFYDASHPGAVGVFGGRNAVLPPTPLSALAVGLTDLMPQAVLITTQGRSSPAQNIDTQSPLLLLASRFDLVFVFVVLYPLVVLTLAYDLVSRDRELGRLALLLAHTKHAASSWSARGLARVLPLALIGVAASCLGLTFMESEAAPADTALRLALWCALILAYGAVWFSLGALISVCSRSSGTSALVSLGMWLSFVVIVPSAYDASITALYPSPSQSEHLAARRDRARETEEQGDEVLAGYLHDHPELATSSGDDPMMSFLPRYLAITEAVEDKLAPLQLEFERVRARQRGAAQQLRFVSPALILQHALCDLAGTGPERHAAFLLAARDFQDTWRRFFMPRAVAKRRLTSADYAQIPAFELPEPPVRDVVGRSLVSLAALTALACSFVFAAQRRMKRLAIAES
jgi:ABC-2 type transport system permease protein